MTLQQVQLFLGGIGFDRITNTAAHQPVGCEWYAMEVPADTVIATATLLGDYTLNGAPTQSPLNGASLKAGDVIFAAFVAVQLTSGEVRMVKKRPGQN